jgi:hypothetical protein
VSASTTASRVAGAFASMNSHMEFTDSHLHYFNYTSVRARASHQAASHRSLERLRSAFCRPGASAQRCAECSQSYAKLFHYSRTGSLRPVAAAARAIPDLAALIFSAYCSCRHQYSLSPDFNRHCH